jgi:hypothetical protein
MTSNVRPEPNVRLPFNIGAKVWAMDPDEDELTTGRFGGIDPQTGDYLVEIEEDHGLGRGVFRRIKPEGVAPFG